jgi:hypothetical protein
MRTVFLATVAILSASAAAAKMSDGDLLNRTQQVVYDRCMVAFGMYRDTSKLTDDEKAVDWQVLNRIKPVCAQMSDVKALVPSVEEEMAKAFDKQSKAK